MPAQSQTVVTDDERQRGDALSIMAEETLSYMLLVMDDVDAMLIQEVQRILAEIHSTKRDIAIAHGELLNEINVLKSAPIDNGPGPCRRRW